MEPLTNFHLDLSEKLQLFIDGRLKNDMVKFLMNYIQMVERGQEFVFASRSQDWNLHLESCEKLAVDYHSTNRQDKVHADDAILRCVAICVAGI